MVNNMDNCSSEMAEAVSTIHALINSRKELTTDRDLMREYRELNGETIQYRKFGFRSLDQFLDSTGKFIIRRGNAGDLLISAVPTMASKHIADMVSKQRSDRKKKSRANANKVCILFDKYN